MKKIIILILLFPLFFNGQTVFNSLGATIYGVIDTGNTNPRLDFIDSIGKIVSISGDGNTIVIANERTKTFANSAVVNGVTIYSQVFSEIWPQIVAYKYVDSTDSWIQKGNKIEGSRSILNIDISKNGDKILCKREGSPLIKYYSFNGTQWMSNAFPGSNEKDIHLSDDGNSLAFVRDNNVKVYIQEFLPPNNWVAPSQFNVNNIVDTDFKGTDLSDGWISSKCIISSHDDTVRIFESKHTPANGYVSSILDVLFDNDTSANFGSKVAMSKGGHRIAVLSTSSILNKRKVEIFEFQDNLNNSHYLSICSVNNLMANPKDISLSSDGKVLTISYPDSNQVKTYYINNATINPRQTYFSNNPDDELGCDVDINDVGSRVIIGTRQNLGYGYVDVFGCTRSDTLIDNITACGPYTWVNGETYYVDNDTSTCIISSVNGCEQISKLNLVIYDSTSSIDQQFSCDASFTWINGKTYYSSYIDTVNECYYRIDMENNWNGIWNNGYIEVFLNGSLAKTWSLTHVPGAAVPFSGIDSILVSNGDLIEFYYNNASIGNSHNKFKIYDPFGNLIVDAGYGNLPYQWSPPNGFIISDTSESVCISNPNTVESYIIPNINGCDSIISLELTFNFNQYNENITVCDSLTWIDGITYTASNNTGTHILTVANDCDSLINLDLTVNYSDTSIAYVNASCDYTWIDGITYSNNNDTSSFLLTNDEGCDSLVFLDLTIDLIHTDILVNFLGVLYTSISNGQPPYSYYWNTGQTTNTLNPISNGIYWVIVTDANSCIADTAFFDVTFTSDMNVENSLNSIKLSPNPTSEDITISIENFNGNIQTEVYDIIGNRLQTTNETTISLRDYSKGIYILKVAYGDKVKEVKVIKE